MSCMPCLPCSMQCASRPHYSPVHLGYEYEYEYEYLEGGECALVWCAVVLYVVPYSPSLPLRSTSSPPLHC